MKVSSSVVLGDVGASPAAGTNESARAAVSKESMGLIRRAARPGEDGKSAMVLEEGRSDVTRKSISDAALECVTSIAVMWRLGVGMSQRPGATT